ncbi:D-glycerate dehydrogenase [Siminovitchia fortis]|uniref:D-glycerate dehydrogenase n=1 Tax=Siminovitchia fortis TaxID=254758 RepID=A0A443IVU5_9BACI|nr:D-glycerate dehydrogenase [Siminovitchia fortis]RWR12154.1 D-glycerate dehydrogenase [Siminovitchia fortis]WHY81011.1 D-glycerate dehydrogenase [Siminovitchia fortis]
MKPKVFIAKPVPEEVEAFISKHCDYRVWRESVPIPEEVLKREVADVEGLMTPKGVITEEFLSHAPKLKIVSNIAVGYDAFDIEAMRRHGVIGTHTPGVLDDSVADLVFSLLLATARRIPEYDSYVKKGNWSHHLDSVEHFGKDVHHRTLGIIGPGRIGEKIAKRAALGFDMKVIYHSRAPKPKLEYTYGAQRKELHELLAISDYVVVMVPLTEETHHFIGAEQFNLMKKDSVFINAARGAVIDEQALIEALKNGRIWAAGLDVYETEPVETNNPLLQLSNVVTLPHIGSATAQARFDMAMLAAQNLVAGVTGGKPKNVVKELRDLIKEE